MFYKKRKASAQVGALAFNGRRTVLDFVQRSQTSAADVNPGSRITFLHGDLLNIRQPAPLRSALGMTHIVADHGPFSAQVASNWHRKVPLSDLMRARTASEYSTIVVFVQVRGKSKEKVYG